MKRLPLIFFLFFCIGLFLADARAYVSPTLELQKCRKISDREERNHCMAKFYEEQKQTEVVSSFVDAKEGEVTESQCRSFTQSLLRAKCFSEYYKQEKAKEQEKARKDNAPPPEKPEAFLKIIPCEKIEDRNERIACYNTFHKELLEKQEAQKKKEQEKKTAKKQAIASPTLRLLACQKISDRTERNDCYVKLREQDAEEQNNRLQKELETFNAIEEEKKCLEISDTENQAECFHRLEQLKQRVYRAQDSTFQPEDVREGR